MRDPESTYNPMSTDELQALCPGIAWSTFYTDLFKDISSEKAEPIVVNTPAYFKKLSPVLASLGNDTMTNYLIWRAVQSYVQDLDQNMATANQNFQAVRGNKEQTGCAGYNQLFCKLNDLRVFSLADCVSMAIIVNICCVMSCARKILKTVDLSLSLLSARSVIFHAC